jgi:hypothetical protein
MSPSASSSSSSSHCASNRFLQQGSRSKDNVHIGYTRSQSSCNIETSFESQ